MITDLQTNTLFVADCLPSKQPQFFHRFEKVISNLGIKINFLPHTKDIWAVDYMPVQVVEDRFIQFTYDPDYLKYKKYRKTISDVDVICETIGIATEKSKLIIDGGNVIKAPYTVIMCEKVFSENKHLSKKEVIKELKLLFEIDRLFFIPWDTYDYTGHADGMLRPIDRNTVLINNYSKSDPHLERSLKTALHNAGLEYVELPYDPPKDPNSAQGTYLNYLQMEQGLVVPIFNTKEDEKALRVLETVFKGQRLACIESNDLAIEGGILNCITWNIKI